MIPRFLLYFATPAGATADLGGGGAAPPAAPAGGSTPPAAPSPGQGTSQGQGTPGGDGIAQLRQAYEKIKQDYEPWSKLNVKPEQVTQYSTVYQKTFEEIASIGRQLGYPDDEIIEAIQENPVATLDVLRNELAAARQGQSRDENQGLQDLINQRLEEGLRPVNEWHNEQLTREANNAFERVSYQLAGEMYKTEGLDIANVPADEVDMLLSATSEILKYDDGALKALKYEGKTAAIKEAFNEAKTMLDKYFVARSGRSNGAPRGAAGAAPGRAPNGQFVPGMRPDGKTKANLDDFINNPELIGPQYAERK